MGFKVACSVDLNTSENIETPFIMKGVDDVYEINPQLNEIGSKEQYSQYLSTLFPNPTPILYKGLRNKAKLVHDTPNHNFYTGERRIAEKMYLNEEGLKFFLSSQETVESYRAPNGGVSVVAKMEENFINNSSAEVILLDRMDTMGREIQYVINKSTPKLQLGTEKDLEGFKEFVSQQNTNSLDVEKNPLPTVKYVDTGLEVFSESEGKVLNEIITEVENTILEDDFADFQKSKFLLGVKQHEEGLMTLKWGNTEKLSKLANLIIEKSGNKDNVVVIKKSEYQNLFPNEDINTFRSVVKEDGKIYIFEGASEEIQLEEVLHPIILNYFYNNKLEFNRLLKELTKDYPEIVSEVNKLTKLNNAQKENEIVTRALAKALIENKEIKNKSIIEKLSNLVKKVLKMLFGRYLESHIWTMENPSYIKLLHDLVSDNSTKFKVARGLRLENSVNDLDKELLKTKANSIKFKDSVINNVIPADYKAPEIKKQIVEYLNTIDTADVSLQLGKIQILSEKVLELMKALENDISSKNTQDAGMLLSALHYYNLILKNLGEMTTHMAERASVDSDVNKEASALALKLNTKYNTVVTNLITFTLSKYSGKSTDEIKERFQINNGVVQFSKDPLSFFQNVLSATNSNDPLIQALGAIFGIYKREVENSTNKFTSLMRNSNVELEGETSFLKKYIDDNPGVDLEELFKDFLDFSKLDPEGNPYELLKPISSKAYKDLKEQNRLILKQNKNFVGINKDKLVEYFKFVAPLINVNEMSIKDKGTVQKILDLHELKKNETSWQDTIWYKVLETKDTTLTYGNKSITFNKDNNVENLKDLLKLYYTQEFQEAGTYTFQTGISVTGFENFVENTLLYKDNTLTNNFFAVIHFVNKSSQSLPPVLGAGIKFNYEKIQANNPSLLNKEFVSKIASDPIKKKFYEDYLRTKEALNGETFTYSNIYKIYGVSKSSITQMKGESWAQYIKRTVTFKNLASSLKDAFIDKGSGNLQPNIFGIETNFQNPYLHYDTEVVNRSLNLAASLVEEIGHRVEYSEKMKYESDLMIIYEAIQQASYGRNELKASTSMLDTAQRIVDSFNKVVKKDGMVVKKVEDAEEKEAVMKAFEAHKISFDNVFTAVSSHLKKVPFKNQLVKDLDNETIKNLLSELVKFSFSNKDLTDSMFFDRDSESNLNFLDYLFKKEGEAGVIYLFKYLQVNSDGEIESYIKNPKEKEKNLIKLLNNLDKDHLFYKSAVNFINAYVKPNVKQDKFIVADENNIFIALKEFSLRSINKIYNDQNSDLYKEREELRKRFRTITYNYGDFSFRNRNKTFTKDVTVGSIANALENYTRMKALGFHVMGGLYESIQYLYALNLEASGGRFFDSNMLNKAFGKVAKNIGNKEYKENMTSILEYFKISDQGYLNGEQRTKLTDYLFIQYKLVAEQGNKVFMEAFKNSNFKFKANKIVDGEIKEVELTLKEIYNFDAFSKINKSINDQSNEPILLNDISLTTVQENAIKTTVYEVLKGLRDRNQDIDPIAADRGFLKYLMTFKRNWLVNGFYARFGAKNENIFTTNVETIGTYRGLLEALKTTSYEYNAAGEKIETSKLDLSKTIDILRNYTLLRYLFKNKNKEELIDENGELIDYAIRKSIFEIQAFLLLSTFVYYAFMIIKSGDDDEEDSAKKKMAFLLLNVVTRANRDISTYMSPTSLASFTKDTVPTLSTVTDAVKVVNTLLQSTVGLDPYKYDDTEREELRIIRPILNMIPIANKIYPMINLTEKEIVFN